MKQIKYARVISCSEAGNGQLDGRATAGSSGIMGIEEQ